MNKTEWQIQRERHALLALEDGTVFRGYSCGAPVDTVGEVVFNTGMSGYQEILSDPSYCGQLVTMTYPEIGNTGMNAADMESRQLFANGLIVQNMNTPSNWRSEISLAACLVKNGIPAIGGIDTRAVTSLLREKGSLKGYLSVTGKNAADAAVRQARQWAGLDGQDYAQRVTCDQPYQWEGDGPLTGSWGPPANMPPAALKIVAYDFGIKWNILRCLRSLGMATTVVPAHTPASTVLSMQPQGVLLSNGPADPAALAYAVQAVRALIGKVPIMGICLGHQILGLALGGQTGRLKFGHHGCNHPVADLLTGKTEITSQNHNFAVARQSLDAACVEITHINLNDHTVEGFRHRHEPLFGIQYHPESSPGPHDAAHLFGRFKDLILSA